MTCECQFVVIPALIIRHPGGDQMSLTEKSNTTLATFQQHFKALIILHTGSCKEPCRPRRTVWFIKLCSSYIMG